MRTRLIGLGTQVENATDPAKARMKSLTTAVDHTTGGSPCEQC